MTKPKTNRSVWLVIALLAGVVLALARLTGGVLPGQYVWLALGGFKVVALWNSDVPRRYWLHFDQATVSSPIGEDLVDTGQLIRLRCLWVEIEYPNTPGTREEPQRTP